MENMTAKELFNMVKTSQEDISIVFLNPSNQLLANRRTHKLMDLFNSHDSEGRFYGVHGDLTSLGQLNNRENVTDEEMIKIVEEFMLFGKPINKKDITKDMSFIAL